ncbi:MAG: phage replisome organizer N-terminal domain-containing protein [Clostridiales bacterium]|nr:phage replisome organizer N-terminal domain-containing protein [Clostridiales bacterium]
MNGRFYWLKLKKDFFKRHDILYLHSLENGNEVVLFYLKLMLESVDHEGELRFNENLPYTPEMLASITDTDIEIVRSSLEQLEALKMVRITDDGTIVIDKVKTMIGSAVDNDNANRQRRYRESQKDAPLRKVTHSVTKNNESKSKSKRQSKSKSKSKRQSKIFFLDEKNSDFVEPTIEEICEYCESRHNGINPQNFFEYYSAKNWCIGSGTKKMTDWRAAVRAWETNQKRFSEGDAI